MPNRQVTPSERTRNEKISLHEGFPGPELMNRLPGHAFPTCDIHEYLLSPRPNNLIRNGEEVWYDAACGHGIGHLCLGVKFLVEKSDLPSPCAARHVADVGPCPFGSQALKPWQNLSCQYYPYGGDDYEVLPTSRDRGLALGGGPVGPRISSLAV